MRNLRYTVLSGLVLAILGFCTPAYIGGGQASATESPNGDLRWYDIRDLGVEGRGWTDTKSFFDRLPAKADGVVPPAVWNLGTHSAGMSVRFVTNATEITARWTLRGERLDMPHMPATGVSGLDLYVKYEGHWRWLGLGKATQFPTNEQTVAKGLSPGRREYRLYLPLYNGVEDVWIGVPSSATLEKAPAYPPDREKPVVFYGTSITQGGCVSRPGMAYPAILGRRLERPTINLGFSGNGRMQPEVVALLAELDPAVYVIDCLPNMDADLVATQTEPLVRTFRAAHPSTPILLIEDRTYGHAFLNPDTQRDQAARRAALRKAFDNLEATGVGGLVYIKGEGQVGNDGEALVDGSHPSDLGMLRQADTFEPPLRRALAMGN